MDSAAEAMPRGYRIGCARVSTRDQDPDSQRDALPSGQARTMRTSTAVLTDARISTAKQAQARHSAGQPPAVSDFGASVSLPAFAFYPSKAPVLARKNGAGH